MVYEIEPLVIVSVASTVEVAVPASNAVAKPKLVMLAGIGAVLGEIVKARVVGNDAAVGVRPSLQTSSTANCCVPPTGSVMVVGRVEESTGIACEAVMIFSATGAAGMTVRTLGVAVGGTVTQ
jgi:hypothetical protein